MGDNERARDQEVFHLEDGIPVFHTRLDQIQAEQEAAKKRDKEFREEQLRLNRRMTLFTGLLVIIGVFGFLINAYQSHIAKLNADAASDNAASAKAQAEAGRATVEEMKKSSTDTHELAVQAKNQADRMKEQLPEIKKSADAAKQSLAESDTHFQIEQRPYLVVRDVTVPELKSLDMGGDARAIGTVDNIGRGVAFDEFGYQAVDVIDLDITQSDHSYEELAQPIDISFHRNVGDMMERAGRGAITHPVRDIAPGQSANLGATLPPTRKITTNNMMGIMFGRSFVVFMGMLKYTSFGQTHETEFCWFTTKPQVNEKESDPNKKVNYNWVLCKDHNTIR